MYVATAEAGDAEMADRIRHHQLESVLLIGATISEAPRDLARALESVSAESVVIVDCLTLWLSNTH